MSAPLRYPRPASIGKLGPGHNVVESSAGTGKTFLLEHLFVELIINHSLPVDQILVVTFTEKATAELILRLRRLVDRLSGLRADDPEVIKAAGLSDGEVWIIDERRQRLLTDALLAFDRASIFTIHAFCRRVLREHAFAQGRLFDEELVDSQAEFGQAFHEVLRTQVKADAGLRAAIKAWLETGRSIGDLAKLLQECDGKGAALLRPIFDEKALEKAMAAWKAVEKNDAKLIARLQAANVNGRSIPSMLTRLGRASEIVIQHGKDPIRLLAQMQEFPNEPKMGEGLNFVLDRLPDAIRDPILVALKERAQTLEAALVPLEAVLAQLFLPAVSERAWAHKRRAGQYDFSDMLALVAEALADPGPAGRALAHALRKRYRHALIDEFQDTDAIQWSIFRRIFVEPSDQHALTVIGDPKQAIYGFRGADVRTYLSARAALRETGAPSLIQEVNFRSTADLVEATNHIFDQRTGFFRQGSGIDYHPVRCGRDELALLDVAGKPQPPVVILDVVTAEKKLHTPVIRAAIQGAIVREILALTGLASPLRRRDGKDTRKFNERDIFILTFTNRDSRDIGRTLGLAGIPYAFYKQDKLFASAEAEEILALLHAILAPEDGGLRAKALLTDFFALDLAEIAACAGKGSEAEPARLLASFAGRAESGDIPALFAAILDETGILRRQLFADAGERGLTNVMHVFELLQAEWARSHASLAELARLLDGYLRGTQAPPGRESDLQRLETDRDAVQILTVYKAKGLEADVVFVYGGTGEKTSQDTHVLHEGDERVLHVGPLDPGAKTRAGEEKIDERSRLLYVALTRARFRLCLPHYPAAYKPTGPYKQVNDRLDQLLASGSEATSRLWHQEPVACPVVDQREENPPKETPSSPIDLPPGLLAPVREPPEIEAIKKTRAGFIVTSYTSVKRARAGKTPIDEAAQAPHADEHEPRREPAPDHLPGGAETGIFLHEILAEIPLPGLAALPAFEEWIKSSGVEEMLERQRRRHNRPAAHARLAARLVHRAYTTKVRLHSIVMPGLALATQALREMEFLFPMPERSHPRLARPLAGDSPRTWKVERGVVKGFIDLLFEHEGRVYVCDWKSDDLQSFAARDVARHCEQHYDVQACLYTLATLRMFGIGDKADYERRFGSVVFCFLRGRRDDDEQSGIHHQRPGWDEILVWEQDMLENRFWGLAR